MARDHQPGIDKAPALTLGALFSDWITSDPAA